MHIRAHHTGTVLPSQSRCGVVVVERHAHVALLNAVRSIATITAMPPADEETHYIIIIYTQHHKIIIVEYR